MYASYSPALWDSSIVHMGLYYAIATEQNPSSRSYFYLLVLVANIALLVIVGLAPAA